ncbi:MAG: peptidoglycan DD-metalloendopeptidase family protein [Gammaproteobacteria bacterium]|nr:peptidoglycan DD-metalloendopeptidase family protein [Gammaproteobacteria bacterium]
MRRGTSFAILLLVLPALAAGDTKARSAATEADLASVRRQIERISEQASRAAVERDRLARELGRAEQSVAEARRGVEGVRRERVERSRQRSVLAAERREREASLAAERRELAGQIRAAYLIGREEPLRLLLNQRDPARAGRMFTYYGYFGRARAAQIARIEEHVAALAQLDRELEAEEQRMAELEGRQRQELGRLEQARAQRSTVLASLDAESRSRTLQLERLKREQGALEALLRELRRALERLPPEAGGAFAKLRGRLAWPVSGRILASFGESRAGGLRWQGMLLGVERGVPVRAIYQGRVAYADWLPGLGLLVIVDHGQGYLSLYGHNEQLYRKVGERVATGDTLAAAGDSGGRSRPELYFEIRSGSRPVDPRPWFRQRDP